MLTRCRRYTAVSHANTTVIAQTIIGLNTLQATLKRVVEASYFVPVTQVALNVEIIHRCDAFGRTRTTTKQRADH